MKRSIIFLMATLALAVTAVMSQVTVTGTGTLGDGSTLAISGTIPKSVTTRKSVTIAAAAMKGMIVTVTPPPPVITVPPIAPPPPATQTGPIYPNPPQANALPVYPGDAYPSDAWLATFSRDANGFLIPPAAPANAVYFSDGKTAGSQPTDFTDFKKCEAAAQANGSWWIWVRDGGVYANSAIDDNWQMGPGTASHPVVLCRTGPNGYNDRSLPPPKMEGFFAMGGTEYGGDGTMHYCEVFGLNFYANLRDPASPNYSKSKSTDGQTQNWAFQLRSFTGASDHILFSDCHVSYFGSGYDIEGDLSYPAGGMVKPLTTAIWDHCDVDHCYGTFYGIYCQAVEDVLLNVSVFAENGYNQKVDPKTDPSGMEHDVYLNGFVGPTATQPLAGPSDMLTRAVGCIFGGGIESFKDYQGGLCSGCLFLGDAMDANFGQMPTLVDGCVCDGDNAEFDAAEGGQKGYALALTGDGSAPRGWGFDFEGCATATCQNSLFIDKPDTFNNGVPIYIDGQISFNVNGYPTYKSGPTTLKNLIVSNWTTDGMDVHTFLVPPNPPNPTIIGCDLPGQGAGTFGDFPGINLAGAIIPTPNYVNPSVTVSSFAASLGLPGVTDGPSWLTAAISNSSANWNQNLTAGAAIGFVRAGFTPAN